MKFSSKEEYGMRAVMYLAANEPLWPLQTREIASKEGIPEQFLEQVLAALRRAGIVRSLRGAFGGYELARPSSSISAGDVITALTGPVAPFPCPNGDVVIANLRQRLQSAISEILDKTTIHDMVEERLHSSAESSFMMHI